VGYFFISTQKSHQKKYTNHLKYEIIDLIIKFKKMPEKKTNIKQLTKDFWALSRKRQESFIKELYDLSSQNKDLFKVRLGEDYKNVVESLKVSIHKETTNRIGKFRKIKLSKLNVVLKNTEKYGIPILQQIEIRKEAWRGILNFIGKKKYLPERYEVAAARHLDTYLSMIKMHILEKSEQTDRYAEDKKEIEAIMILNPSLGHITDVYIKYWNPPKQ
jgi:hypothetical protein